MTGILKGRDGRSGYGGQFVRAEECGDGQMGQDDEECRQLDEPTTAGYGINETGQGRKKTECDRFEQSTSPSDENTLRSRSGGPEGV